MSDPRERWPAPDKRLQRLFHPLFGWGRAEPPGPKGGTLFFPECAVDWWTRTPLMGGRPDHVDPNEPVYIPFCELRSTDELSDADYLSNMALMVKLTPKDDGV